MTDVEDARPIQIVFGPPEEIDIWKSIGGTTYVELKEEIKEGLRGGRGRGRRKSGMRGRGRKRRVGVLREVRRLEDW